MSQDRTRQRLSVLAWHLTAREVAGDGGGTARTARVGDTVTVRVVGRGYNPSQLPQFTATTENENGVPADFFENDTTSFVCGPGSAAGGLQPALSATVVGMHVGETKEFVIRPSNQEHPQPSRDETLIFDVPSGGADVKIGMTSRVMHNDQPRLCTVIAVNRAAEMATVDCNDPLAGKTLVLTAELLAFDTDDDYQNQLFPAPAPGTVPGRVFQPEELALYNGTTRPEVLIGVRGHVYDVTESKFYGPGGPYSFMAGQDATVSLASFSMNPALLNTRWSGPGGTTLDNAQNITLANYIKTFRSKYATVGTLAVGKS